MLDKVTDAQLIRLAATACRGKTTLSAASYTEGLWRGLVDMGLLRKIFISWDKPQYTILANESAWEVVMANIPRAVSLAIDFELFDIVEFLLEHMSSEHLPELLSHEKEELRTAAVDRLSKLVNSNSEKNKVHIL